MNNSIIIGLLAETPIHPGIGQEEGAIDLPVAREEPFGYPCVPYRGVKGALREKAWRPKFEQYLPDARSKAPQQLAERGNTSPSPEQIEEHARREADQRADQDPAVRGPFGAADDAGHLITSDARLLLLPVRSFPGSYKWVTCPQVIERFRRDLARADMPAQGLLNILNSTPPVAETRARRFSGQGPVLLEDLKFEVDQDNAIGNIAAALEPLIGHPETQKRLRETLTLVNDNIFAYLARTALPVTAHNELDMRKRSNNLFYEETIPTDAVMYLLVTERFAGALQTFDALFSNDPYLRLGGNETVGQGWFRVVKRYAPPAAAPTQPQGGSA